MNNLTSSAPRPSERPPVLLATMPTPSGNVVQLSEHDGRYELQTFTPLITREIDAVEARDWYATTSACGGKLHARFPEAVAP